MPTTFDISESPQPSPQKPTGGSSGPRGTGTAVDDFARTIFYIALAVMAGCVIYLGWGMFCGTWSGQQFAVYDTDKVKLHHLQALQLANIALVSKILMIATITGTVSFLICSFRDEGIGYVLAAIAIFVKFGIPYLCNMVAGWKDYNGSPAMSAAVAGIQAVWLPFVVPGIIWILVDFVRRLQQMAENTAIQKANFKYGSSASRQSNKSKQKFLGRCWELPYCKDTIRAKCPVFLRKRGPCWWYKEGCMCEEHIVLQAAMVSSDWRQPNTLAGQAGSALSATQGQTAKQKISLQSGSKLLLSAADKRERCRKCIIYNEHQSQKYKLVVAVTLTAYIAAVVSLWGPMQVNLAAFMIRLNSALGRFNLTIHTVQGDYQAGPIDNINIVQTVLMGCAIIVILSQILKMIEYLIFKLKV